MKTLDNLREGQSGVICQINLDGPLCRRINELGITKGAVIKKLITSSFGDPAIFDVRGYRLAMRKSETSKILIEE